MDSALYLKILKAIPLFQTLKPEELEVIVQISRLLRVKDGVEVVTEGDEGASMYVLVSGTARVTRRLRNGKVVPISELSAPSVFGEMSLIDRFRRSATVTTTSEAVLFQIDLNSFNAFRAGYHPAAFKVLRELAPLLCGRLRQMNERIGEYLEHPEIVMSGQDEWARFWEGNQPVASNQPQRPEGGKR